MGRMGEGGVDVSDADAVLAEVMAGKTFYSIAPPRKTGNLATVAIAPGSSAYPAGYHVGNVGGLPAIDADLVTANIKATITIFNVLGSVDVRDISDADLVAAEAPTGKFFYAVGGGRKTGSGTQALNPANQNVPAGYYVATTLSVVDGDLVTANIKSGINIFGVPGHANVRNVSDANALVAEVRTGRTFYAVGGARKTGTMPTVAIVAGSDTYSAGYHVGNAGGLDAIDLDLAPGNIKDGVNIFGKVGTFTGALAEDVEGSDYDALPSTTADTAKRRQDVSGTIASKTLTFGANALVFAAGFCIGYDATPTLRLYMDGVLMQTSAAFANTESRVRTVNDFKVLTGSKTCYINLSGTLRMHSRGTNGDHSAAIGVGSVVLA